MNNGLTNTRTLYALKLSFEMRAPVFSHGISVIDFGMDAAALVHGEHQALPGSLIKGNMRDVLTFFADKLEESQQSELRSCIKRWFGEEALADNQPQTGSLNFDYYWLSKQSISQYQQRNRVQISPQTGVVEPGALQLLESPFPTGQRIDFSGAIKVWADSDEIEKLRLWLAKAAGYISAMGAFKSVGFGQVLSTMLTYEPVPDKSPSSVADGQRVQLRLKLDRPLCVAEPHLADSNVFRSLDHIPGNVIKGTIAAQLQQQLYDVSAVNDWATSVDFEHWTVTHAFPVTQGASAEQIAKPLAKSLYFTAHDELKDLIRQLDIDSDIPVESQACAVLCRESGAVAFQADWKDPQVGQANALINPDARGLLRDIKVSTSIHSIYREDGTGYSNESALFAREECETAGVEFVCEIDLGLVREGQRRFALSALREFSKRPLMGIGKTKAIAAITLQSAEFDATEHYDKVFSSLEQGRLVLTLKTHANLFVEAPSAQQSARHAAAYRAYFDSLGVDGLSLSCVLASQTIRGGGYLQRRFSSFTASDQTYAPQWLTEPGSVFVFQVDTSCDLAAIATTIVSWLRYGLPLANSVIGDDSNSDWMASPYIGHNGFGQVFMGTGLEAIEQGVEQ